VSVAKMRRDQLEGLNSRGSMFTLICRFFASATTALGRTETHAQRVRSLRRNCSGFAAGAPPFRRFRLLFQQSIAPDVLRKVIPYLQDAELSQFEDQHSNRHRGPGWAREGLILWGAETKPRTRTGSGARQRHQVDPFSTSQQPSCPPFNNERRRGTTKTRGDCRFRDQFGRSSRGSGCGIRKRIQWALSLKALTYFADGDLPNLTLRRRKSFAAWRVKST